MAKVRQFLLLDSVTIADVSKLLQNEMMKFVQQVAIARLVRYRMLTDELSVNRHTFT